MKPYLIPAALAALACSCSDDSPSVPTPVRLEEIAVVVELSPARLQVQRPGNAAPVQLLADCSIAGADIGERILILYNVQSADTTRRPVPVNLTYAGKIINGNVSASPLSEIVPMPAPQCSVISSWRSGTYLNMQVKLQYDGTPRSLAMAADKATLGRDTVECYLYNPGEAVGDASVRRHTFASFDVSGIISRPGQHIRIHENH